MAVGKVRHWRCDDWQQGLDCGFDTWAFYLVRCVFWAITAMLFFALTFSNLRSKKPTGPARRCLLLSIVSAILHSLDSLLFITLGNPRGKSEVYGLQLLSSIGTILLVASYRVFIHAWCDVAAAWTKPSNSAPGRLTTVFQSIRVCYTAILVVHVPLACVMSVTDYRWGPDYDTVVLVYMTWLFLTTCLFFTATSLVMIFIAKRYLGTGDAVKSFKRVTVINLLEQVTFDACCVVGGALYLSQAYNDLGAVQAVVYTLNFLLVWFMHIQLLFFFTMCDLDDPLYSQEHLSQLLNSNAVPRKLDKPFSHSPAKAHTSPSTTGPPDVVVGQAC